jgi:hypothetical protein
MVLPLPRGRFRDKLDSWRASSRLPPDEESGPGFLRPHPIFATEPFYELNHLLAESARAEVGREDLRKLLAAESLEGSGATLSSSYPKPRSRRSRTSSHARFSRDRKKTRGDGGSPAESARWKTTRAKSVTPKDLIIRSGLLF